MNSAEKFYIDVAGFQKEKHSNEICGDVFMTRKVTNEDRTIIVLADGLGSGTKANILASMTASMAINFSSMNAPLEHTAQIILNTLPIDRERKAGYSSFSIIDIEADGAIHLVEYGNPEMVYLRNGESISLEKAMVKIRNRYRMKQALYFSSLSGKMNDRIIVFSDGISQSGIGSKVYPFGWQVKNVRAFVENEIKQEPAISSFDLSRKLTRKAIANDAYRPKDDITAGVVYLRQARKLLVCTGPPFHESKDKDLASEFDTFPGSKVICGGTTANILSRELNRTIRTEISFSQGNLPPVSKMEKVDLITEGILTLGKTHCLLEENFRPEFTSSDPATMLCNQFMLHDEIQFIVGTRVNEAHQDPTLPVELEIRRNVIKKIARELEEKYLKTIIINYI